MSNSYLITNKANMKRLLDLASKDNEMYTIQFLDSNLVIKILPSGNIKRRKKALSLARTRLSNTEAHWFKEII